MSKYVALSSARTVTAVAALAFSLSIAGCKTQTPATDDATVSTALHNRIAGDSALASESIQSSAQNGIATLNGTVSSEAARALAANDAAQVAGVRTVINNLTVQTSAPAPVVAETAPPAPIPTAKTPATATISRKPSAATRPSDRDHDRDHDRDRNHYPSAADNPAPIERAPMQQAQQQEPPPPPPPPAAPAFRDVTIPSGSTLPIRITQTLDSATTQPGESFTGTVATDVIIDGLVAIHQGTPVTGRVDEVHEAAHFKGSSLLTIELTNINRNGQRIPVTTESFSKEGSGRGKNTAEKVGGGAAVGAILGGILGGGKGAAVGAAAGGGLGAGAQAVTKGQQVQIPSETLIRFRLTNAIQVRASTRDASSSDPNLQRRPLDSQQ